MTKVRRLMLTLLVAAVALRVEAAERPDFTGLWVPDAGRSSTHKELKGQTDAPAPPPPPSAQDLPQLRIEHREPKLTVSFLDSQGELISSLVMTTDGVEATNERGGGSMVHRSTTVWQGSALVTTWRLESGGTRLIGGTDTRELSDAGGGGRLLTITGDVEDARSKSRTVTVYTLAPSIGALERIFQEDQSDGRPYGTPEERALTDARVLRRIEEVSEIVDRGLLRSADDYYHAAMIFQHGVRSEDHLKAHVLASVAGFKGHPWGRWLSAASLDLFLLSLDRPQILGTIYGESNFGRYDRRLNDVVRREYCVPSLEIQVRNQQAIAQGRRGEFQRRASECESAE
ncbi:MAG TPA: hypothetical protein VN493_10880 [Thermoanaerobaculia bacterium]|nr:hypothetical protein [Thermoanaerobaculia bacterium]